MAATNLSASRRKNPWVLTIFGLLAVAGLVAMPFLAGEPDGEQMPDIVRFLGHFHPVLLHLPIGVFILILAQELGLIFFSKRGEEPPQTTIFPLFFGAASAIVAVIAGFLLYHGSDDYAGNEIAERHLWGGLIFAVAAVVTFILKAWTVATAGNPAFYRLLLFSSVGVMGFASHDGASMTHGSDYLIKYAPDPIRSLVGAPPKTPRVAAVVGTAAADPGLQLVYADIVAPILERRCVQCHKDGKSKGRFRMDSYELLVKGGKEGTGIEPGNAADSNIVIRMELPADDDERMPPDGKTGLADHELAVVKWWIDNGADAEITLAAANPPATIQQLLALIVPTAAVADYDEATPHGTPAVVGPSDALKNSVIALSTEFPGALSFESQQSALLTFTAVSMRGSLDDAVFQKLKSVTAHLVTADLSATRITDQSVALLADAKDLRLVRLAETDITDAAIDTLLKLESLESINLYGTKVTDAGVSKLSAMPNLKRLYLWQTAVTPEAIQALKDKLPDCEIIAGIDA